VDEKNSRIKFDEICRTPNSYFDFPC
jgi:hypothetical protein